jgi:hypothetical protein
MHLKREMHKPRFGKPQIKYGQTLMMSSYTFQTGGLLGATFFDEPTAFLTAYNGAEQVDESLRFVETRLDDVLQFGDLVRTLSEFVSAYEDKRLKVPTGSSGMLQFGTKKLDIETAFYIACDFGMLGATLGLERPDIFGEWFEANYAFDEERSESWRRMHEAGLAIPAEPNAMTYGEAQQDALDMFVPFSSEFFPEFKDVLVQPKPASPANVARLMDALRASMEATRQARSTD